MNKVLPTIGNDTKVCGENLENNEGSYTKASSSGLTRERSSTAFHELVIITVAITEQP